jgi:hypothetical protein
VKNPRLSRRRFLTASGMLILSPALLIAQEARAQSEVVDRSGSLRMLSQRMTKAYAQIGKGVLADDAQVILSRSITRFETALSTVRANPLSNAATVAQIASDWERLRQTLALAPTKALFMTADTAAEAILKGAETLTAQLATSLSVRGAKWTNLSGRQRMLSQRMAKSALALMWGLDGNVYGEQLDQARKQIYAALDELKRAPHNSPVIARELEQAEIQLGLFDVALGSRADYAALSSSRANNVAKTNERVLELFDGLTAKFAVIQG